MSRIDTVVSVTASGAATTAGTEIEDDLLGRDDTKGYVEQVTIVSTGTATSCDFQLRLVSGSSDLDDLVVKITGATLPYVVSDLRAPFDLKGSGLIVWVDPDADDTITVRVDARVMG